jgi:hypothetical protein
LICQSPSKTFFIDAIDSRGIVFQLDNGTGVCDNSSILVISQSILNEYCFSQMVCVPNGWLALNHFMIFTTCARGSHSWSNLF